MPFETRIRICPGDWNDESCRALHYSDLGKPQDAGTFITSLKQRLAGALEQFNRVIPALPHLRIFRPNKKEDRGLWALAKLEPQPEPESLGLIKSEINDRYGMLDLLDVLSRRIAWWISRDSLHTLERKRCAPETLFDPCSFWTCSLKGRTLASNVSRMRTTATATKSCCMCERPIFRPKLCATPTAPL